MVRRTALAFALVGLVAVSARAQAPETTTHELRAIIDERDLRYTQRFNDQALAVQAALAAAEKAVLKAEGASDKRFESVNEFRGQLKDQAATFMPRTEAGVRFSTIEKQLGDMQAAMTRESGRAEGANWLWGLMLGVGGLAVGLISAFGLIRARGTKGAARG